MKRLKSDMTDMLIMAKVPASVIGFESKSIFKVPVLIDSEILLVF